MNCRCTIMPQIPSCKQDLIWESLSSLGMCWPCLFIPAPLAPPTPPPYGPPGKKRGCRLLPAVLETSSNLIIVCQPLTHKHTVCFWVFFFFFIFAPLCPSPPHFLSSFPQAGSTWVFIKHRQSKDLPVLPCLFLWAECMCGEFALCHGHNYLLF